MGELLEFRETTPFGKVWGKLMGNDAEMERRQLEQHLQDTPEAGELIPRTGGARKLRWKHNGGKRGGARVIYYYRNSQGMIFLIAVYSKREKENLTSEEEILIKKMIKNFNE